ncbi:MAG: Peptidase U32 [Candidatus Falkowbacteria bacterium GW2011_GWF2_39_8]|uniref:Peptidase U32 n=1 Tax=Candidatus Falkowbacteria bacterium GW2011_GWF2_39_8 TaxID=1618642 RepID=A0A0G0PWR5_9BACT|nr:MAG: Peptidase U32 [Candidatus Falkowbacteria bacterium GW2011_GWF2_39_8]
MAFTLDPRLLGDDGIYIFMKKNKKIELLAPGGLSAKATLEKDKVQKEFKNKMKRKIELLAPAGNLEKMKTAFAFGADAVYAGIPDFSLRVRINDFTLESLKEAIDYAHSIDRKVYVTINIFAHNKHLAKLPAYIKKIKDLNPDGLIVSDPGVMNTIKENWPDAVIHLSTQANCTNWQAAKFWQTQGVERVILGREVTIEEIREINKKLPKLELETFVHGAMCMAYSGRCFLSKYFLDRSANLGDCVQPCRWEYDVSKKLKVESEKSEGVMIKAKGHDEVFELVEEQHGSYILNSKDMCLLKHIEEMIDAGIISLKIEGRAKSVYYLAMVIGTYRAAIEIVQDKKISAAEKKKKINYLYKELESKVVHRGYTEGFAFGRGGYEQNLENSHQICEWEFCGQIMSAEKRGKKQNDTEKTNKYQTLVKIHNSLHVGDQIEIVLPGYDIIKMKVKKIIDSETGELMESAHGGQKKSVILETIREIPEFSVIRRLIK